MATGAREDEGPGPIRQPDTGGEQHGAGERPPPGNAGRTQPFEEPQTLERGVGPVEDDPGPVEDDPGPDG
jgi:hypothetical protein